MFKRTIPLLLAGTILSFGGVANAQDTSATTQMNASANTSTSATATSSGMFLAQMQDDAYVVVDGTVGEISGDEFTLNMTNGSIVVELDRFDLPFLSYYVLFKLHLCNSCNNFCLINLLQEFFRIGYFL